MAKLYELSAQVGAISDYLLQDENPADETILRQKLSELTLQFNEKAESIAKIILSYDSDSVAIKAETDRLSAKKSSLDSRKEWLKNYLLEEMITAGKTELPFTIFKISVATNPMSIEIVDINLVPKEFQRCIPESWIVEKKTVADRVKATGEIPPGIKVITDRKSLRIK